MTVLVLLTAADCHLCAHGRETLDALATELLLRWREVDADSEAGRLLAATAPPLRPVLLDADGAVIAYGRLSPRRLARDLRRIQPEPSINARGQPR